MADNIFQRKITPVVPKTLSNERIYVYVPDATGEQAGVASYNLEDFTLDRAENNKLSIIWPYADSEGNVGLIGVDTEDNYLEVNDETHLLSINTTNLNHTIDERASSITDSKISLHNTSEEAHQYIQNRVNTINLIEIAGGKLRFTNADGVATDVQGGYLPDNTTIELNSSNRLVAKALKDGATTITVSYITNLNTIATQAQETAGNAMSQVNSIWALIPNDTSLSNKIANWDFVNSSISNNTATFRGTYNLVSDLGLGLDATEQEIAAALANEISIVTNNDYCYVEIPQTVTDPSVIQAYDRYKYTDANHAWEFEFELNNSSFTAAQWAAINSGITSILATKIGNEALTTVATTLSGAVNELNSGKQATLISGTNIKTINGTSLLGAGDIDIKSYEPFPADWTTDSTTAALMADIEADTSAVVGKAYLGDVELTDMPFVGNAEVEIKIINGTGTEKTILATLTSGNISPNTWQYTYWVISGAPHNSGWIAKANDSDVVHLSGAETISGQKTFTNMNRFSGATIFSGNVSFADLVDSNIRPKVTNAYDLGSSGTKWKDLHLAGNLSDGTNSISIAGIIGSTFNVINATDIVNNTLTQAQFDLITNGKPTIIKGTFLGYENPLLLQPTTVDNNTRGLLMGNKTGGTYIYMSCYQIANLGISEMTSGRIRGTFDLVDFGSNASISKDSDNRLNFKYNNSIKVKVGSSDTLFANRVTPDSSNTYDLGRSGVYWKDLYLAGNLNDGTNAASVSEIAKRQLIAPEYDDTATYIEGSVVIYNNVLYECNTDILIAEDWTSAHWTAIDVIGYVDSKGASKEQIIANLPPFKSTIRLTGISANTAYTFPIVESSNFGVDWGDGTFSYYNTATTTISHTYTDSTAKYVNFYGEWNGIQYTSSTDTTKTLISAVWYDKNIDTLPNYAFYGCSNLNIFDYKSRVLFIGDYAFRSSNGILKAFDFTRVRTIGQYAFAYQNTGFGGTAEFITGITNGNLIGSYAFSNTTYSILKLTSMLMTNSIFSMNSQRNFDSMSHLFKVICNGIYDITSNCFYHCSNLATIIIEKPLYYNSYTQIIKLNGSLNANDDFPADFVILVPYSQLSAYKTATNWSTYANKIYPIGGQYSETVTIASNAWTLNAQTNLYEATATVVGATNESRNILDWSLVDSNGNQIEDTYGLGASAQGSMSITFTAQTAPTDAIYISVQSTLTNYRE